mmetsp:Transcript_11724/g.14598  ORF Transcript_11724/g.14598 Transcript_11724/m.14598 type:complete len:84 (-) Transcript_11724:1932-2183(-)
MKTLVVHELNKAVSYHVQENDSMDSRGIHGSFLPLDSVPDLNWEIHSTAWASQVYLDTARLSQIFAIIDSDITVEQPDSILTL